MQIGDRDDRHAASRPSYIDLEPLAWPARRLTAEVKEDGQWVEIVVSGREAQVWNRHGILLEIVPLAKPALGASVLYAELLRGTTRSKGTRKGQIVVFDCVEYFGDDVRGIGQHARRSRAGDLVEMIQHPRFEMVRSFVSWSAAWDYVIEHDLEGIVLKDPMAPYGDPWCRMKRVVDVDYACMGYRRDKRGTITAIEAGARVDGIIQKVGKVPVHGEARRIIMADPAGRIGHVFKARGNDLTAKGALRNPRFLEWHADKTLEDL